MTTRDQILTFLTQNKKLFRDKFHIIRIGLFGSYARGDYYEGSDIDLLAEFEEGTENLYELKLQLKDFFRINLGLDADICCEKYIKSQIKNSILKEAINA